MENTIIQVVLAIATLLATAAAFFVGSNSSPRDRQWIENFFVSGCIGGIASIAALAFGAPIICSAALLISGFLIGLAGGWNTERRSKSDE